MTEVSNSRDYFYERTYNTKHGPRKCMVKYKREPYKRKRTFTEDEKKLVRDSYKVIQNIRITARVLNDKYPELKLTDYLVRRILETGDDTKH